MNIRIFSILFFTGIHFFLQAQSIQWEKVSEFNPYWSVSMPGEPEYYKKEILTHVGEMEIHSYMLAPEYSEEQSNLMYLIEYYDYPEGSFHPDSIELIDMFLDQTAIATSSEVGGELVYESNINKNGHRGKLYRCQYKDATYIMKSKMYLVGDRFYHLKVYCKKEYALNEEMDTFLDSFRLIK